jgi:hydroxyacylglutathione hydrolase
LNGQDFLKGFEISGKGGYLNMYTTKSNLKVIHAGGIFFNSYLVFNGENFILIDSGRRYSWKRLCGNLESIGVNKNNLAALILTHTHFDHAENAAAVKKRFGAKIIVHESEAAYLEKGDSPLSAGTMLFTKILMKLFLEKVQPMFRYQGVKCDIAVSDRLDLNPFGFGVYILHTPGHTRGSMSIIVDDEIAFIGDNMVGVFNGSIFPPFGDDIAGIIRIWKRLLDTGCSLFIPVHGSPKRRSILQKHYEKIQKNQLRDYHEENP